jgi:uncharacterized membrane protein
MSLIQINLHTEFDNKYKDLYVEVKNNTSFNHIFNKINDFLNENSAFVNISKIVINDNIFMHLNLSDNFMNFLTKNNLEYYELDDLSIICFVNTNVPELVDNEYLTNINKKNT